MSDAGTVAAIGENLRATLPTAMMIGGLALVVYAVYLDYVALPEERTRKRMIIRGALVGGGLVLLLTGVALQS